MKLNLKNKKVLIVGASKNLGKELAIKFQEQNCKITLLSRDKKELIKLHKYIGGFKNGHEFYPIDLMKSEGTSATEVKKVLKNKSYDIIIHTVGGALGVNKPLATIQDWYKVWKFNIGISIEINNIFIPKMLKKKWGRIVHISSMTGEVGEDEGGPIPYSASKAYLNNYVKSLGKVYAKNNIVISAVMPGALKSKGKYWEMIENKNPKLLKNFLKNKQSIGRLGMVEEISPFVILLASEQASFAAGSIFPVHGGWNY
jgi:3-oxoacyl-[acyl-carrier protein] reductase